MKYIYYKDNGDISMICPVVDSASNDSYIEVEDQEADNFFSGKFLQFEFKIVPDPDVPKKGWVEPKFQRVAQQAFANVNDRVFEIPKGTSEAAFKVFQNLKNKTIHIELSTRASTWWRGNDYFNLSRVFLVACLPHDPHHLLWRQDIPADQLSENYSFEYTGEDNIVLYTRKIFNNYTHELLS